MSRRKSSILTKEKKDFIFANYKGTTVIEMCRKLENTFGGVHGESQIQLFYYRNGLHSGKTGRFEKNTSPFNKGLPSVKWAHPEALENMRKTQFKKGHKNNWEAPVGFRSLRVDKRSGAKYVMVKVGEKDWRMESRVVWEQYHGKISDGCLVMHLDHNGWNNDINNLQLVSWQEAQVIAQSGFTDDIEINKSIIANARLKTTYIRLEKEWKAANTKNVLNT